MPNLSPSTSTFQDFTDTLITNLKDKTKHPNLQNVIITDGPPSVDENQFGEWIMFGNISGKQEWATIANARKPKNEVFTLECWIDVVKESDIDQTSVNRRCAALFAEVENELRNDPAQGLFHVLWSGINNPFRITKNASDTWRECWLVAGIEVHSRI